MAKLILQYRVLEYCRQLHASFISFFVYVLVFKYDFQQSMMVQNSKDAQLYSRKQTSAMAVPTQPSRHCQEHSVHMQADAWGCIPMQTGTHGVCVPSNTATTALSRVLLSSLTYLGFHFTSSHLLVIFCFLFFQMVSLCSCP